MAIEWFASPNGVDNKVGPYSNQQLAQLAKSGKLKPSDHIWHEGMAEWVLASKLKGLFSPTSKESSMPLPSKSQESAMPPLPRKSQEAAAAAPPPIPKQVKEWYYAGSDEERNGPFTLKEMKSHKNNSVINTETLVWKAGMAEWLPAGQITDLFAQQPRSSEIIDTMKSQTNAAFQVVQAAANSKTASIAMNKLADGARKIDYGVILLAIPIVATIVVWVLVAASRSGPPLPLTLATIALTAAVASIEAAKVGMTYDRQKGTNSPTQWFLSILVFWIGSYPAYLYKRRHYGLKNYLVPGLVVTVVFLGSLFAAASIANTKRRPPGVTAARDQQPSLLRKITNAVSGPIAPTLQYVEDDECIPMLPKQTKGWTIAPLGRLRETRIRYSSLAFTPDGNTLLASP